MNSPIDDRKDLTLRGLGMARAKTAIVEGETRAKVAIEEAETRVEAVILEAEARVKALIAETYQRMQEIACRRPSMAYTPTPYDWENIGTEPIDRPPSPQVGPDPFREAVSVRAYYKAEQRGFEPGKETADWLEAERELMALTS